MINFGNKTFSNVGLIAAQALLVALVIADERGGLDFVNQNDFRGILADDAGYLNAIFVNPYGAISQLQLSESMLVTPLAEIRQAEIAKRQEREREAECQRRTAEIRGLELDLALLEEERANLAGRIYNLKENQRITHQTDVW